MRIVGLSASLANAREVGEWMGVPIKSLFNFSPKIRPIPLEISIQTFDQNSYPARLMAMAKPTYNAIVRHSDGKPVIVIVPSRRQAQLTAIDIMAYNESQEGSSFLGSQTSGVKMETVAATLREPALQQTLPAGVGFLHRGMVDADKGKITDLFDTGSLGVLVCPVDMCWELRSTAHLVVIMGTEMYDGRERRHVDIPIVDVLHVIGKASRQAIDRMGKCVILCHAPKKEYLKKLLYDPLPIESHLDQYLHDPFNSEIVTKTICNMQDAVDYITWTFLYRRLTKNPNYYGLQGTSNVHLSEHLSEMVEAVLGDLEDSKCCQMSEDGDVSPLNLGMIAAYYYTQYQTIELIASSVTAKTKIRGVTEILAASSEFSMLPMRFGEEKALKILARNLPYEISASAQFNEPNTKALVLLQCHFSRKSLSAELREDEHFVVKGSISLIQAIVDVISSNGWLKPALAAMELSQMVVQGLWNKDNVLMQVSFSLCHFRSVLLL
jgi:pre-mRNA-splicing helicase BRR2